VWIGLLAALVVTLFAFFFKEIVAFASDEDFARVQGVPVGLARAAMLATVTLTVVVLVQLVGIVLVLALLTIPAVIGLTVARRFGLVVAVSTVVGALLTSAGLALSYRLDLPSGAAIVLLGVALLAGVKLVARLRHRD
jgi:zinc transport system permease protein